MHTVYNIIDSDMSDYIERREIVAALSDPKKVKKILHCCPAFGPLIGGDKRPPWLDILSPGMSTNGVATFPLLPPSGPLALPRHKHRAIHARLVSRIASLDHNKRRTPTLTASQRAVFASYATAAQELGLEARAWNQSRVDGGGGDVDADDDTGWDGTYSFSRPRAAVGGAGSSVRFGQGEWEEKEEEGEGLGGAFSVSVGSLGAKGSRQLGCSKSAPSLFLPGRSFADSNLYGEDSLYYMSGSLGGGGSRSGAEQPYADTPLNGQSAGQLRSIMSVKPRSRPQSRQKVVKPRRGGGLILQKETTRFPVKRPPMSATAHIIRGGGVDLSVLGGGSSVGGGRPSSQARAR